MSTTSMDYYSILGVAKTASAGQIKEAFLRLARESHPDRFRDPADRAKAEERFQKVNEAFNHLKDEKLRQEYDRQLARQNLTPTQEAELYFKNGRAREQIEENAEALQFYYEAMRLDPENGQYVLAAARVLGRDGGKTRQAAELYEKAIQKDPTAPEPYAELGDLYARLGLATRARRVYETGLRQHPGDPQLRAKLQALGGGR